MKRIVNKSISVFLVVLMLLSIAPLSEIAKIDFSDAFKSIVLAVENVFKSDYVIDGLEAVSCIRKDAISTQASGDISDNLTVGDTVTLTLNLHKEDENGNIVDFDISELPPITWSAYPSESVQLTKDETDPRRCSVKVLSDKYTPITVTATLQGVGSKSFTINISSLTFDKNQYYILVDDTTITPNMSNYPYIYNNCYAIWNAKKDGLDPGQYTFTSSDESILRITSGTYSYVSKNRYFYYPKVLGVKEGEVTLKIEAPDGQTAECNVTVIGMKEYYIEAYSEEMDRPIPDAEVEYEIIRGTNLGTQAIETVSVKTGKDGIAKIMLPDVKEFPNTPISIREEMHPKKNFTAGQIISPNEKINRAELNFDMNINAPSAGTTNVEALSVQIGDKIFSLINNELGIEIGDVFEISGEFDCEEMKLRITGSLKGGYEIDNGKDKWTSAKGEKDKDKRSEKREQFWQYRKFYKGLISKENAKSAYNKMVKDLKAKETKNFMGYELEMACILYVELDFSKPGKPVPSEGGVAFAASTNVECSLPLAVPGIFMTWGFGVDAEGDLALVKTSTNSIGSKGMIEFKFGAKIGVGAGYNGKVVDAHVTLGVDGYFKFNFTFESEKKLTLKEIMKISAELNLFLEYEAGVWVFKVGDTFKLNIAECELFPNKSAEFFNTFGSQAIDESFFEQASRDYLYRVSSNSIDGEFSINNIFTYTDVAMEQLNDGTKVVVWVDDNGTKSDINRTTLMYSVFDGKKWSEKKAVYETGKVDCTPKMYSDGDRIYLLWSRGSRVFEDTETYNDFIENTELVFSSFDRDGWTKPEIIGNVGNGKYQQSYSIAASNGKVNVSWVENSKNDLFLIDGTTTIYQQTKSKDWDSPTIVTETMKPIGTVQAGFISDIPVTAYWIDLDEDLNSSDNEFKIGNIYTSSSEKDAHSPVYYNGTFYWIEDGTLVYYDNDKIDTGVKVNRHYKIVSNGSKTSLIYPQNTNGFETELFIKSLDNTEDTTAVALTSYKQRIDSFGAVMNNDSSITVSSDIRNISESMSLTDTDLVIDTFHNTVDAAIIGSWYSFNDRNDNAIVHANVMNAGTAPLNKYTIYIKDASEKVIYCETINQPLKSGANKEMTFSIPLTTESDYSNVSIYLESYNDVNIENNTINTCFDVSDIEIKNCTMSQDGHITAIVKNKGYVNATEVYCNIEKFDEEYIELSGIEIGTLRPNESKQIEFQIDIDNLKFESYLENYSFRVKAESSGLEMDYSNNESIIIINSERVRSIMLEYNEISITPSEEFTLNATVYPENAVTKTVYWFSDDSSIAEVDKNGKITAKKLGTTTVTAVTSDGRFESKCIVNVVENVDVNGVELSEKSIDINPNTTFQLEAYVKPDNATNKNLFWSSSNTKIATVSSDGLVTAKAVGIATITVRTEDGNKKDTCTVNVTNNKIDVTGVSLTAETSELFIGETLKLVANITPQNATNQTLFWSSSNTNIATVSSEGVVTAKSVGTVMITVRTEDGNKKATCTLTVKNNTVSVTGVSLNKAEVELKQGETLDLVASVIPDNATNKGIAWFSSDSNVATVDSDGKIVAVGTGNVVITVKTQDGNFEATCNIVVKETSEAIKVISSISVNSMPSKTSYTYKKDNLNTNGFTLMVMYTDGTSEIVSDTSKMKFDGFSNKPVGNKRITVYYEGFTTEFDVSVKLTWWQWIVKILLLGFIWY